MKDLISSQSEESYSEQQAEHRAEERAAAGLVHCPRCDAEVPEDEIETCRCGTKGCRNCFYPVQTESFADEYVCSVRCEKESLEQALNQISSQRTADFKGLVLKYDRITTAIAKRIDAINRTAIREDAAAILFRLDVIRQGCMEREQPGNAEIITATMDLIRRLSK
jgi:hypothetical protein